VLVSLPFPLTDGTTAFGSQTRANDNSIVAVVNGGLDNDNMRTNADAAGKGLTADKLADSAITTVKLAAGAVTFPKLADDSPLGSGANLSELLAQVAFNGTGGFPSSNINANRQQGGGKTGWGYFAIAVGQIGTDFILDDSIDWRKRLIMVMFEGTVVATVADLPGGANDHLISGPFWTGGPGVLATGQNGGMFYSENGQATGAGANPAITLNIGAGATPDTLRFYARSTDGFLMVRATAIAATGVAANVLVMCSPHLGTT
jgi:hypothetical protein